MDTTIADICKITDKDQAFALIADQEWDAKKKARARLAWKKKNDNESIGQRPPTPQEPPVEIPMATRVDWRCERFLANRPTPQEQPVAIPVATPVEEPPTPPTPQEPRPEKERLTIENARVGMIIKCTCQGTVKYFRIEEVFTKTIKVSYWNKVGKQLIHTDEERPCRHYLQVKRIIHIVKNARSST